MIEIDAPTLTAFTLYLALMIAIGLWVYRQTYTLSDFALGGRRLGSTTAALSAGASDMSGWLLLGLPGAVYAGGIGATWIAIGLLVGTYLNWLIVAPRLRTYTERAHNAVSLSAYLESRFEDTSRLLRIVSAVVIIVFFTIYVTSGLVAGGVLFESTFGVNYTVAVTIAVVVIVAYSLLGGFLAVSITDTIQGTLMFFALLLIPVLGVVAAGGIGATTDDLETRNPGLLDFGVDVSFDADTGQWGAGSPLGAIAIVSLLAWGLGYFGQPHILARFMGIRRREDVPVARRIGTGWAGLTLLGASLVGLIGISTLDEPLDDPETVFLMLIETLTNPWVGGALIAAVLAAIMSTADSQLLVSSTALTEDFYRALLNRQASDRVLVAVSRASLVIVALVAYMLALPGETAVLDVVAYAWAGFGAAFGPVILLSLYWSRMTRAGAMAGIIAGAGAVIAWEEIAVLTDTGVYSMIPGWCAALLAAGVFGRFVGTAPTREWVGAHGTRDAADTSAESTG